METTQNQISKMADVWAAYSEQSIKAYQSDGRALRDHVAQQRPADPQSNVIPGKSELPVTDANRIHELNRNTVLVTPQR